MNSPKFSGRMALANINGAWIGEVTFGYEYGDPDPERLLFFDLEMVSVGKVIAGTAIDTGGFLG